MNHRQQVIDYAIKGLTDGGMTKEVAELFRNLLDKIYETAYNEAIRNYINDNWK